MTLCHIFLVVWSGILTVLIPNFLNIVHYNMFAYCLDFFEYM